MFLSVNSNIYVISCSVSIDWLFFLFIIMGIFFCFFLSLVIFIEYLIFFFLIFWPYLQHMEVPWPGTESEPQLQTMPELQQLWSLAYYTGLGIEPSPPQQSKLQQSIPLTHCNTAETPAIVNF